MTLWDLLVWCLVISFVVSLFYGRSQHKQVQEAQAELKKSAKQQMAADIQATKTSRVVDQIEIIDELGTHTQNFRQYCELVGTSMKEGGVTAPYSGRQVAYYDVKCYRLESVGGRERETLVAHETSIEPFYFTDSSCDTPVYVDLKSFGDNVILVNSTNHVEGPNSSFTNAFNANTGQGSSSMGSAYAMVERAREAGANWLAHTRNALRIPQLGLTPALAYAGPGYLGELYDEDEERGLRVSFAQGRGGKNISGSMRGMYGMGGFGHSSMPQNLGSFLGSGHGYVYGLPNVSHRRVTTSSDSLGNVLVGMTLAQLLRSMNSTSYQRPTTQIPQVQIPQNSFHGYRIVEDVVPLGSPTYVIGELYRAGTDVYMGRSLAADYTTSYFACRPEAEVLSALAAES